MKQRINRLKEQAMEIYRISLDWIVRNPVAFVKETIVRANADGKERNRVLIQSLSLLLLLDYFMFCLHIEKNIFDIFPSIPLLNQSRSVTIFLPMIDKSGLFEEKREIPVFDSDEKDVKYLFSLVMKGSIYENTSISVPVNLRVRKIWFLVEGGNRRQCVIDVDADTVLDRDLVIKGSESLFRKALEKTITGNLKSVKSVTLLEKGIQDRSLWEL